MYEAVSVVRNKIEFKIPKLNQSVYSFEGFCYYLYNYIEEFVGIVEEKKYIIWIKEALKLEDIVIKIEMLYEKAYTIEEKMLGILDLCAYTRQLDHTAFKNRFKVYEDEPIHIRYKKTGDGYFGRENYKEALRWYKLAQRDCYSSLVENNIGIIYMYYSDFEKAGKAFDHAIANEDRVDIRLNKVKMLFILEEYEAVLVALNSINQLFKDNRVWYYFGSVYKRMQHYEEALTAFLHGYELTQSQQILKEIMLIEVDLEYYRQVTIRLMNQCSNQVISYYIKAYMMKKQEKWADYILYMEKVLELVEEKTSYLLELSRYYINNNQIIKAIEYIGKIDGKAINEDEVNYQKLLIAKTAGNHIDYQKQQLQIINKWKSEVRQRVNH